MTTKDLRSDRHIRSLLTVLISLDKFYGPTPFTSINSKEQILKFLGKQYVKGKWVERDHDLEGKWISTFNYYLGLLSVFFRWLTNRDKPDDKWVTPSFIDIKNKKPLRESPYSVNDIWQLDDVLTIVSYAQELRDKAIITLM